MRKLTAILAIIPCLYSPCRFGLIVLEEAAHFAGNASSGVILRADASGETQYKKILSPGKYLRRPFLSKDKNFTLVIDPAPIDQIGARFEIDFSYPELFPQRALSHLRAPPRPL